MSKSPLYILFLLLFIFAIEAESQYKYFITFTDKADSPFSLSNPEAYLSQRAINRRNNQSIAIDMQDIPVNKIYCDAIKSRGYKIHYTSKWLNGVLIESATDDLSNLNDLSYIASKVKVWYKSPSSAVQETIAKELPKFKGATATIYSQQQTENVNGQHLHNDGCRGKGIQIAVLDAGFAQLNSLPMFEKLRNENRLLGTKDFVNPLDDFYATDAHGMMVMGVMCGYLLDSFEGTAIDAQYWIIRTEDNASEFPIEEYNWVVGAEFADSVGVDIINSSLGYSTFDDAQFNYTYAQMDGKTTIVAKGAKTAINKGIIVVNSLGNEGVKSWKYMISPSDVDGVIGCGGMKSDSTISNFSSFGPTPDLRVKPDVTAQGTAVYTQGTSGNIVTANGTSFSSPIVCGLTACLLQKHPNLKPLEMRNYLISSANHYQTPHERFGYGIANFDKADQIISGILVPSEKESRWSIVPNPASTFFNIYNEKDSVMLISVEVFDSAGKIIFSEYPINADKYSVNKIEKWTKGVYFVKIKDINSTSILKIIKTE